ncbi:MAG: hypothetical protein FJY37_03845 [Betaproteobacteria bacterium]|nr:hypothetical protein [Betaproteobacteria bacterium]
MRANWRTALDSGDIRQVRKLIAAGADVNTLDRHGQNALMRAAHAGRLPLVHVLLANGAELDRTAKHGLSALMLAVIGGHDAIACRLIDAGADIGLRGTGAAGFAGKTAFDLAQAAQRVRTVARLRFAHAKTAPTNASALDANGLDGCDVVRIHEAFRRGDLEMLRSIVPHVRLHDAIGSWLVYAIYHSPPEFVRVMLNLGAAIDERCEDGFPPLIAVLSGREVTVDAETRMEKLVLLLEAGADPDVRGLNDYAPLHLAAAMGNHPAVLLLLQSGADPRLRTRIDEQVTPAELAGASGHEDVVALLAGW